MKKILLSLAMIAMVSTVAVGATRAYFTGQGSSINNTVAAGTIVLLPGLNSGPIMAISNLEPGLYKYNVGDAFTYDSLNPATNLPMLHIQNMGSLTFKYRMYATFGSQSVGGFWELLWVRVYRAEGSSNTYVKKWEGLLKDMDTNIGSFMSGVGNLAPGSSHDWRFDIGLDSTANNTYQGASSTFNFVVDATQTTNPGWTE